MTYKCGPPQGALTDDVWMPAGERAGGTAPAGARRQDMRRASLVAPTSSKPHKELK
jgi:hypothetical protein